MNSIGSYLSDVPAPEIEAPADIMPEAPPNFSDSQTSVNETERINDSKEPLISFDFNYKDSRGKVNESLFAMVGFDPQVAPGQTQVSHSALLKKEVDNTNEKAKRIDSFQRVDENGNKYHANTLGTLKNTMTEEGRSELRGVVADFAIFWQADKVLQDAISNQLDGLKINDIRTLTPRQAILLSNFITVKLTEYDYSAIASVDQKKASVDPRNRADYLSAGQILRAGLNSKKNHEPVKPLGVCRNFAQTEYAVFETLKGLQSPSTNRLNTTSCGIIGNTSDRYMTRLDKKDEKPKLSGHQWCMYSTTSADRSVSVVVIDPTWRSNENKNKYFSQHERFEPIIHDMVDSHNNFDAPRANKVMKYYGSLIDESHATVERTKKYWNENKHKMSQVQLDNLPSIKYACISKRNYFISRAIQIENVILEKDPSVAKDPARAKAELKRVFSFAHALASDQVSFVEEKTFFEVNEMLINCMSSIRDNYNGSDRPELIKFIQEHFEHYKDSMSKNQSEELLAKMKVDYNKRHQESRAKRKN